MLSLERTGRKSTLIKIIAGVYKSDSGSLVFNGEPCRLVSPAEAFRKGIAVIHQETSLIPCFSVLENVFLGIESVLKAGILSEKHMLKKYSELNEKLGIRINPKKLVRDLSVAEQKLTEIMKALMHEASFIIMDEPTIPYRKRDRKALFNHQWT